MLKPFTLKERMKKLSLLTILLILSTTCLNYKQELYNCSRYPTMEARNLCRQDVTAKYRYIEDDPIEVNIYHLPKIQKNVGDFKLIFDGVDE